MKLRVGAVGVGQGQPMKDVAARLGLVFLENALFKLERQLA